MTNTLVNPLDLMDLPGYPFNERLLDIAVANLRGEVGWHIAPLVTETVSLPNRDYGQVLYLPTRKLVAVTAVRNMTPTTPVVLTGYTIRGNTLYLASGWPTGRLEVDMQHGYTTTPVDLLPVVAARIQAISDARDTTVSQYSTTVGGWSETLSYRAGAVDTTLDRYTLPAGVA